MLFTLILCGGCGRRMTPHNLELHATNDDDDDSHIMKCKTLRGIFNIIIATAEAAVSGVKNQFIL